MSTISDQVREFMSITGVTLRSKPEIFYDQSERDLMANLLEEETQEFMDASDADDLVEMADALADIVYVAYGNALRLGIDLDAVLDEVHRANMSKLNPDGSVHYYPGTVKVGKGPNYSPPDVAAELERQKV